MMNKTTRGCLSLLLAFTIAEVACNPTTPITPTAIAITPTATIASAAEVATPVRPFLAETPLPTETPRPMEIPPAAHEIVATYTLPDLPLGVFQNALLPGSIANDRKLFVGGFADLWRSPSDLIDQFWVVTDRGPNKEIVVRVTNEDRRILAIPGFNPMILRIQVQGDTIQVLETVPILTPSGKPVTGLTNIDGYDEVVYDYLGQTKLAVNPNGLDTKGLIRGVGGDFWLVDAYSPSLVHLNKTGMVLKRYIPLGLVLTGAEYPVAPILPSVLTTRKSNRGFAGMALSESEKTLYMVVQSPLRNPDRKTGDASRITRLFAFDIASEKVVAEYAYRLEVSSEFDPKTQPRATDMGVCALVSIGPTTLLVEECTDEVAKLYRVDLSEATNIAESKWDDPATTPSLESLADPAKNGVKVLPKSLVVDLSQLPGVPPTIEGVAVIDPNTIAIANDNGYDILSFVLGNNVPMGQKSQIVVIRLAKPLQ